MKKMKLFAVRLTAFTMFVVIVHGCAVFQKPPAIRIDYAIETADSKMAQRFAKVMMDSISVTILPKSDMQVMQWKSAIANYYLVYRNDTRYLYVKDLDKTKFYFGQDMIAVLDQFYFPFYEPEKNGEKMMMVGLSGVKRSVRLDSLNTEIVCAADYKNKLPVFESISGMPLSYAVNCCGELLFVKAQKQTVVDDIELDLPVSIPVVLGEEKGIDLIGSIQMYGNLSDKSDLNTPFIPISIQKDGKAAGSLLADCDGKYELILERGHKYDLFFGGDEYVTKRVLIDGTHIPVTDSAGFMFQMDGKMLIRKSGVDYDLLKEPMAIATYDSIEQTLVFDMEYTRRMVEKLAELEKQ